MDSSISAEKEEHKQRKSLLGRFADHPFECNIKTYKEMKDVMEKKSVRARLLFIAGASLPFSGTSTLIQGILNSYDIPLPKPRELRIYPTAVFIDSVKNDGHFTIFDGKEEECGMLLVALTKQLMIKKFTILEPLHDDNQLFEDSEVDTYFKRFCDDLLKFKSDVEGNSKRVVALMKSHYFINFLDITVNKAIYECLFIVGSWCKKGILLSVLNLYYYSCEVLEKSLNLSDAHFQSRDYRQEDNLLKFLPACHFFVSIFEGIFAKQEDNGNRALLVCTHEDKFSSEDEVKTRKQKLKEKVFSERAADMKSSVSVSDILVIKNTKGSPDYKRVRQGLVALMEKHFKSSDDIELKHLFFYSYLKSSTNKIILSREDVNKIGAKCEVPESEVSKCLRLLHDSCFLFCIDEFVILDLSRFIDDIDKLYCIQSEDGDKNLLNGFENGFFSKSLCCHIWNQHSLELCEFYISILIKVGLMIELKNHSQEYFMPSLRAEYEHESVDGSSESLLVFTETTIPYHKQCMFVEHYQKSAQVLDSVSYNVLKLQRKDDVIVKILFCSKFLEISLDFTNSKLQPSAYGSVYSEVKTSCAQVLNTMRKKNVYEALQFPDFGYRFAVTCPNSISGKNHYITFEGSCQLEEYKCNVCKKNCIEERMMRAIWMISACEECTLRDDDKLNASNLLDITNKLISFCRSSDFNAGDIIEYFKKLNREIKEGTTSSAEGLSVEHATSRSAQDQLFYELYTWHCCNTSASKFKLAEKMRENDKLVKAAFVVEPPIYRDREHTTTLSSKDIKAVADWWPSGTKELSDILNVRLTKSTSTKSSDVETSIELLTLWSKRTDGDQKKKLCDLFEKAEYFNVRELFI